MTLLPSMTRRLGGCLPAVSLLWLAAPAAHAACAAVAGLPPRATAASLATAAVPPGHVGLSFLGHASFLIESPGGVTAVTDYNGYIRPDATPDIVTMNHAHSTHYTDDPDPAIKLVLRGWDTGNGIPDYDVAFGDMRIHNVPTNIRAGDGGTEFAGNSIFVFDVADLCVAHLGHLHHTLTQAQLNEIGKIDVVFVPVDGNYTLDLEGMMEVLKSLKAPLMIPMHYFSSYTLERFLSRARQEWDVAFNEVPTMVVSKGTLPAKPKVLILPGH